MYTGMTDTKEQELPGPYGHKENNKWYSGKNTSYRKLANTG